MQNNTPTWTTTYDTGTADANAQQNSGSSQYQPCRNRAGNGDCLDQNTPAKATGWGWFDEYILRIPNANKSSKELVADEGGGVTYQNSASSQSGGAVAQGADDVYSGPPAQTSSWTNPFAGLGTSISNGWNSLFGDGNVEPKATDEAYDPERAYPDNRYQGIPTDADFEPDLTPATAYQDNAIPYAYPPAGIPAVTAVPLTENADTNASGDASNQPSMRGFGTYDMRKGNDPEKEMTPSK